MLNAILKYISLEKTHIEDTRLTKVVFVKDFGPWKKGEKEFEVRLNLMTGDMSSPDSLGDSGKKCKFRIILDGPMVDLTELVEGAGK